MTTFIQTALKQANPTVCTHRGLTGTGEVIAFCGFSINAANDEFVPYDARTIGAAVVTVFEQAGWVAVALEPRRVKATYGLMCMPHYVPRLHVINDTGEHLGDLVFDFKGRPVGVLKDCGTMVRLTA